MSVTLLAYYVYKSIKCMLIAHLYKYFFHLSYEHSNKCFTTQCICLTVNVKNLTFELEQLHLMRRADMRKKIMKTKHHVVVYWLNG